MAHQGFIVEFNRPNTYARDLTKHLKGLGLKSRQLVHKTAWKINYDGLFNTFRRLKLAIARSISKANGSALVISLKTGKAFILRWINNKKFRTVPVN